MAQRAPPDHESRVAFVCGFARRNCPHETMFQDAYQRTNRTRGTKILRYCGGPVYLQVDVVSGNLNAVDDPRLCVFAHFHPKATPGLAVGQVVARVMFRENQQTDTNATGEWIGARLMASADHTTWLFEVNPSGRWYYQWESGATKAQRATEHVFEAYVLAVDASNSRCEVLAKAVSRDFRMISFRRAPSDARPSTPEMTAATGSPAVSQTEEDRYRLSATNDDAIAAPSSRWTQRDSIDSVASSDAEITAQIQRLMDIQSHSRNSSQQVDSSHVRGRRPPRPPAPPWISPPVSPRTATQDHHANDAMAPFSLLPSPAIVRISHEIGKLLDLAQVLPCSSLELVIPDILRIVLAPFAVQGDVGHAVRALIGLDGIDPALAPPTYPPALVRTVLQLALWGLFDQELTETQEAYFEHASEGLLDKMALYESYYCWLERFHRHIETYLAGTNANTTLTALATNAHRWLRTYEASVPSSTVANGSAASVAGCRGLESFVAQAREMFLTGGDLRFHSRRRPQVHQHTDDEAIEAHNHELALFSAVWVTDIDSLQWRGMAETRNASSYPASTPSAFVMMWAWRQVLGFELHVKHGEHAAAASTLSINSLWNASSDRGSRLVLDGKPRWLRVYPSGESTSSIAIGFQRLGHYVASFRRETRELLVNLYSWPSSSAYAGFRDPCCYCSRWCLRLEPGNNALSVRVAVERGRLRRGVDTDALDEKPLAHKLQAVDDWTTTTSLQYAYRRRN